jgi:YVTN family beta-propeller protein
MRRRRPATAVLSFCVGAVVPAASFADEPGLVLERTVSLRNVAGRIDHLAIDVARKRKRLFVSELGAACPVKPTAPYRVRLSRSMNLKPDRRTSAFPGDARCGPAHCGVVTTRKPLRFPTPAALAVDPSQPQFVLAARRCRRLGDHAHHCAQANDGRSRMTGKAFLAMALALLAPWFLSASEATTPLILEATIPLPNVSGRIDHLAVDLDRKRLFVAELGNDTVDVIDLTTQKPIHRIEGLKEPQGVAYLPGPDLLVVANCGDGAVNFYSGADFSPRGVVPLGDDADNVRVDPRNGHVLVGFGTNQIAVIDPLKPEWLSNIPLPSHPESFRLSLPTGRMFVNVPHAGKIVMVDDLSSGTGASWLTGGLEGNFPMALDEAGRAIIIVFRKPAWLALFNMMTGTATTSTDTCGDSDDVFFDEMRKHIYVSCGEGSIDVFDRGPALSRVARIPTSPGARTSLFVPELDRLYLAVRAGSTSGAAVEVYRPNP